MAEPIVGPAMEYATPLADVIDPPADGIAPLADAMAPLADAPPSSSDRRSLIRPGIRNGPDLILAGLARASAVTILLMLAALIAVMAHASMPSLRTFGWRFLTSSEWRPNPLETPVRDAAGNVTIDEDGNTVMRTIPPSFGALAVIYGTAVSSALAVILAVPLSFGAALFLVRVAPRLLGGPVSFLIEFLAAIPSIAFGMWGLFVLAPFLQSHLEVGLRALYRAAGRPSALHWLFQDSTRLASGVVLRGDLPLTGRDMLCGGIVLALMIVPIITAVARDVLRSVPRAQIEGTIALGATWWQSSAHMLRYCRAGLFGAVMLGLARAAGETMAITMVIGNNNQIRASLFAPAQTMSSLLANEFAEASTELHRAALSEVALILLGMSLVFNMLARHLVVGRSGRPAAGY